MSRTWDRHQPFSSMCFFKMRLDGGIVVISAPSRKGCVAKWRRFSMEENVSSNFLVLPSIVARALRRIFTARQTVASNSVQLL